MREIKFRAWHTKQRKMYPCEEMVADQMTLLTDGRFINVSGTDTRLSQIDNAGVMIPLQFTGLLDKNGKEIYEGDVLCIDDQETEHILDDGSGPSYPANHIVPVEFRRGSFGVEINDEGDWIDNGFHTLDAIVTDYVGEKCLEVIGNIHENPELLSPK